MHYGVKTSEVKKINTEGSSERAASIRVRYLENNEYRFSVVVSKKQGKAAERNRVKRVIRELMRGKKEIHPQGLYLIYYTRTCEYFNRAHVESDIKNIMKRISLKKTL